MNSFKEAVLLKRLSIRRIRFCESLDITSGPIRVYENVLTDLDNAGLGVDNHTIDGSGIYGVIEFDIFSYERPGSTQLDYKSIMEVLRTSTGRIVEATLEERSMKFFYNDPAFWDDLHGGRDWRLHEYGGLA